MGRSLYPMAHASSPSRISSPAERMAPPALSPFSFDDLVERIRAEFIEQPGLRLTESQGCRLWQVDRPTLRRVLATLTDAAFLTSSHDGRYARRSIV
jgi:hypothetical protein